MLQGCIPAIVLLLAAITHAQVEVDPRLPQFEKQGEVEGKIKSVGSDTLNNLMTNWIEGVIKLHPKMDAEIEGKGSATAPAALIAGVSDFGPMGRPFKQSERADFTAKFGYPPTELRVAINMLAVFVHKDNPIAKKGLTLQQVDAIFSKTREGGYPNDIRTWGDLGLDGDWKNKPISLYGRNSASADYAFFKMNALFKGDFKDEVKELLPGSQITLGSLVNDPTGIGYADTVWAIKEVAAVPLAVDAKNDFVAPNAKNVATYPLTRYLTVCLNYKPGSTLDPVRGELVRYMFSADGQNDVIRDGYLPLDAETARKEAAKVGITLTLNAPAPPPAPAKAEPVKIDPRLPRYVPNKDRPVIGGVKTINSDAMNNMLSLWAEGMLTHFPDLQFEIEGKGGSTPPPNLIAGNVSIGGMTRLFREEEAAAFRKKWGYDATPLRVCIDLLAVYVHKDNPIAKKGLTHRELDAIFSKTRKTGAPDDIKTWGDLGLDGDWKDKPIVLYGRSSASGSYAYVKQHALLKGDFKDEVNEQPGSSSVVAAVGKDRYSIGYSGIGYRTDAVAVVPLSRDEKSEAVPPVAEKVDEYLLGRHFYLYVNQKPGTTLSPVQREYLRYVFSADGQDDVVKDGYLPIAAATAKKEAAKVGIEIELKK